jgi:hypothetical protein
MDLGDARGQDGIRTRRRAPEMRARFQGYVECCAARLFASGTERNHLGVRFSHWLRPSFSNNFAGAHDDGPNRRVWTAPALRPTRQVQRARHEIH